MECLMKSAVCSHDQICYHIKTRKLHVSRSFYTGFAVCFFLELWSLQDIKHTGFVTVLNRMVQIPWRWHMKWWSFSRFLEVDSTWIQFSSSCRFVWYHRRDSICSWVVFINLGPQCIRQLSLPRYRLGVDLLYCSLKYFGECEQLIQLC